MSFNDRHRKVGPNTSQTSNRDYTYNVGDENYKYTSTQTVGYSRKKYLIADAPEFHYRNRMPLMEANHQEHNPQRAKPFILHPSVTLSTGNKNDETLGRDATNQTAWIWITREKDYPMIYVTPEGIITVMFEENMLVEFSVDTNIRALLCGKFAAASNFRGDISSVMHPQARILQDSTKVYAAFPEEKYAVIRADSVAFATKDMDQALFVCSDDYQPPEGESLVAEQGPPASVMPDVAAVGLQGPVPVATALLNQGIKLAPKSTPFGPRQCDRSWVKFPGVAKDCTLNVLYSTKHGSEYCGQCCNIASKATYLRSKDDSVTVNIGGLKLVQQRNGTVTIYAGNRELTLAVKHAQVSVKTHYVHIGTENGTCAFVKRGVKRVHVSPCGMVVSDGCRSVSVDQNGRMVSCNF